MEIKSSAANSPSVRSRRSSTRDQSAVRVGDHLATFPHEGRFWDAFMAVDDDGSDVNRCRARIRFLPADRDDGDEPLDTAVLIIESSYDRALAVARRYQRYELSALLRSIA